MKRFPILLLVAVTPFVGCGDVPAPQAETEDATRAGPTVVPAGLPSGLELVADFNIPTGTSFEGTSDVDFGGISGLIFDPDRMQIQAISDNRANNLLFTLSVQLDGKSISFTPISVTHLEDPGQADAAAGSSAREVYDPEAVARAPGGNLFVSTEGIVAREHRIAPTIAEYLPDGRFVRFLPIPDKFLPQAAGLQTKGIANNLGFEGLTISPDGTRLFTGTEAALVQDDTPSSFTKGSRARLLEIVIAGEATGEINEYVYEVEPMIAPDDFEPIDGENGLVELLALNNSELLSLERKFFRGGTREAPQRRNVIKIFRVSLEDATEVSDVFSLREIAAGSSDGPVPVKKELILDLDEIVPALSPDYPELDNFEGLSFGPILADGSASLIVVSDNNFNPWQRTSFLLFRIRTD
jgi:hypothetical protein